MKSANKRNDFANQCNDVAEHYDIGRRAAVALNRALPSRNRDKETAKIFGVSIRMAAYLRAGQHWTLERLGQASKALGAEFDVGLLLYSPQPDIDFSDELRSVRERVARLEENADAKVVGRGDA